MSNRTFNVMETNIQDNHASLTIAPQQQETFDADLNAFLEATKARNAWLESAVNATASKSAEIFAEDDNKVDVVDSTFNYGTQTINCSVYNKYTLDNGDVLDNHVLININEDFSSNISAALDGVFADTLDADAE